MSSADVSPILSATSFLSLGTTSLFCALDRCDLPHEAAYIPLVLPTVTTDASVATITLRKGNLLEDVTTDAVVSLLAASRDGREPQLGGDAKFLPPGFPFNGAMLMYGGKSVNHQLLTPMMKVFSLHRSWNNHRARSAMSHSVLP